MSHLLQEISFLSKCQQRDYLADEWSNCAMNVGKTIQVFKLEFAQLCIFADDALRL